MADYELKKKEIAVITGPMGSGKSKLFKEIHKTAKKYAQQEVISFSSIHDTTCPQKTVHSRDNEHELLMIDYDVTSLREVISIVQKHLNPINLQLSQIEAELIATRSISIENLEIKKDLEKKKNIVVLVDEVHFLDKDVDYTQIRKYCQQIVQLSDQGPQFIFFGLDLTWERLPWKTTSLLMAIAKSIDKRTAICRFCYKSGCRYTKCTHPELLNGSYITNTSEEIDARKDILFPACEVCLNDPSKNKPLPIKEDDVCNIIDMNQIIEKYHLIVQKN